MPDVTAGRFVRTLTLFAACGLAATARGDEIEVGSVPAGVRKAADDAVKNKTALKNANWTAAEKHTRNNVVKFDLAGETADEYGVFITVTAGGAVEELREQVDFDKLPQAVKKAARDTAPGFKEDESVAYKLFAGKNLADVSFELEGEDAKGRYVWMDFSPDGKIDETELSAQVASAWAPSSTRAPPPAEFKSR